MNASWFNLFGNFCLYFHPQVILVFKSKICFLKAAKRRGLFFWFNLLVCVFWLIFWFILKIYVLISVISLICIVSSFTYYVSWDYSFPPWLLGYVYASLQSRVLPLIFSIETRIFCLVSPTPTRWWKVFISPSIITDNCSWGSSRVCWQLRPFGTWNTFSMPEGF